MVKVKRLIAECHADLRYDWRRAKVAAARNVPNGANYTQAYRRWFCYLRKKLVIFSFEKKLQREFKN